MDGKCSICSNRLAPPGRPSNCLPSCPRRRLPIITRRTALEQRIEETIYRNINGGNWTSYTGRSNSKANIKQILNEAFINYLNKYVRSIITFELVMENIHGEQSKSVTLQPRIFRYLRNVSDIMQEISAVIDEISDSIEMDNFLIKSGYTVKKINNVTIVSHNENIYGSSYISLPKKLKSKKCCINIKNKDNKCFLWCIIAHFYLIDNKDITHVDRLSNYNKKELIEKYNFDNISFPVEPKHIPVFERDNDLTINLYYYNDNHEINIVYPITQRLINENKHVNLLLYKNHYCLIKRLSSLFSDYATGNNKAYVCQGCGIAVFTTDKALKNHMLNCTKGNYVISEKTNLRFKNSQNQIPVPFVIYADFETYFEILSDKNEHNTDKIIFNKIHKPLAYCMQTVCRSTNKYDDNNIYVGKDSDSHFANSLYNKAKQIEDILSKPIPINMTEDQLIQYKETNKCFICNNEFNDLDINLKKVRDHDHISGDYRGASHNLCNLKYTKLNYTIPIIFHNLEGYDLHLFIEALTQYTNKFDIIPKSKEKYLSLTARLKDSKIKLKFIDSLHFITGSLEENAKKLTHFKYTLDKRLTTKQVFPYSYLTDKCNKTIEDVLSEKNLPFNENDWYNDLTKTNTPTEDIQHAHNIFNTFGCKNIYDYTILYLKTDVILLTEIFENFRNLSMKTYNLDPCWYYTTPGFAWDAALKFSDINLQLFNDKNMIDFFIKDRTMRGGISTVSRLKHSIANNPYLPNYNTRLPTNYIMYFDVTNLYGHSMTQYLPYGNFEWLNNEMFDKILNDINLLFNDEYIGYILEVDLLYPMELKDKHIELPLAPEHYKNKLSPNLYSKYKYKTHYKNLKFYIDNGLKLIKIHSILKFSQKPWLKDYIETNTLLRKKTTDESNKNFYKLMNNAVYGKTMENVFNHKNFKLVTSKDKKSIKKHQRKIKNIHIINPDLVLLELSKEIVKFCKPIYIGFVILELSKLHMYNLHYNIIKKKYPTSSTLMYMDTDSLVYNIETSDIYKDFALDQEFSNNFDLSTYPKNFYCYNPSNKGILGTLKDELSDYKCNEGELTLITKFTCLRSKCYSMKVHKYNTLLNNPSDLTQNQISKCKGIPKTELKNIQFDTFSNINLNGGILGFTNTSFRSKNHKIYTITIEKDGLSRNDDKRQIDHNKSSIYTVPWGYDKKSDLE